MLGFGVGVGRVLPCPPWTTPQFLSTTLLALYISGCNLFYSPPSKSRDKRSIELLYLQQSSISSPSFLVVCPPCRAVRCQNAFCLPSLLGADVLVIPSRVVPRLTDLSPVEVRGNPTNRTIFRTLVRSHLYSTLFNSLDALLNAPTKRMASQ